MKKNKPGLALGRETVRNLTEIAEAALAQVRGGQANNSVHINQQSNGTCCCQPPPPV